MVVSSNPKTNNSFFVLVLLLLAKHAIIMQKNPDKKM